MGNQEDIQELKEAGKEGVSWKVFIWAMGIILLLFGWLIVANASVSNKIDVTNQTYVEIRTQLTKISTDIEWIKEAVKK